MISGGKMKKLDTYERLYWYNCGKIDFIADPKKDYEYVIELEDVPFHRYQVILFENAYGTSRFYEVSKIKDKKIYLKYVELEE